MPNNTSGKTVLLVAYLIAFSMLAYAVLDVYDRYQRISALKAKMTDTNQSFNTADPEKKSTHDTRRIASLQLFGAEKKEAEPLPVDAPVTRLKLTLIGIIAADEVSMSRAIIQIDNKQTAIFSVGDKLPTGNAEIHEIQPGTVLLMRKGRLERLVLDRPDLDGLDDSHAAAQKGYGIEDRLMILPGPAKPPVQPKNMPGR